MIINKKKICSKILKQFTKCKSANANLLQEEVFFPACNITVPKVMLLYMFSEYHMHPCVIPCSPKCHATYTLLSFRHARLGVLL